MSDYAEISKKTHIVYLHETWGQSAARDLTTVGSFIPLWSVGFYADSAALEWAGVALGFIVLSGRLVSLLKRKLDERMTPDQARVWLDVHFPQPQEGQDT